MGHYRADLACEACGNVRCTCPRKPEPPNRNFIVTSDFRVVTVEEFDADPSNRGFQTKYGPIAMNPLMYRMGKTQFKKREDAETHARELCEQAVEEARAHLTKMKNICKVKRPWEKK